MRTAGWPGRGPVGLSFGLGLALALGQAPFGLWPLSLAALAGLLHLLHGGPSLRAFWLALAAGAGHFALSLNWIVQPFLVDPWRHAWMAPFALALMALGLGLFWAGAAALAVRARRPLLALAVALPLADLLRGHVLTGFPWALFGHLALGTPVEQLAAQIGAYGLGALIVTTAALPLAAPRLGTVAALVLLPAAWVWGAVRPAAPTEAAPGGIIRLVQPNIEQTLKWDPDEAHATFDRLLSLTVQPPGAVPPALAVWPETAVPFLLREGEGAALAMGSLGVPLVSGYQRMDGDLAWNSIGLFGPDGRITQTYDKIHLVPFGEYIPFGDLAFRLFGLRAFAAQLGAAYSAGASASLMDFGPGLGLARPLICYEVIFPEEIGTARRPGWLLQITNDAWFGTLTGPYQHFDLARLRAIEQGLPMVRVANTGISAVIDAYGQIAPDVTGAPARLPLGATGVIDAPLPAALPPPLYARMGDLPLLLLLLASLSAAFLLPPSRNRT